ncbi:hypothetical protein ACFRK5_16125 [Streptomyces niveus]|uniref:hypothetical protein n=1 Tax=Streptomyces niveus TaxID=193462 RepID=UPI0036B5CC1F
MLRPRVQGPSAEPQRAAPVPGRQHVHGVRLGEREDAGPGVSATARALYRRSYRRTLRRLREPGAASARDSGR